MFAPSSFFYISLIFCVFLFFYFFISLFLFLGSPGIVCPLMHAFASSYWTRTDAQAAQQVREAGKAAVKEAVADELAEERRVRAAVQKEMAAEVKEQAQLAGSNKAAKKATSSSSRSKAAKGASSTTATTSAHAAAICDCETADCSNCPGAQGMWKGKPSVKYNLIGVRESEGCRGKSIKKKSIRLHKTRMYVHVTHT